MRWFGEHWGAPVCDSAAHAETPVGEKCVPCGERIEDGDRGFLIPEALLTHAVTPVAGGPSHAETVTAERPWHLTCMMENVLGPEWQLAFSGDHGD